MGSVMNWMGDIFGIGDSGEDASTAAQVNASQANSYTTQMAQLATALYDQTNPARQNIINRGTSFLNGDYDYTKSPVWQPSRKAVNTQYDLARDNMMSTLPQGGVLLDSLAMNRMSEADALSRLASGIAQDEYNKIYGLASGAPQQSLAGLGNAAGINSGLSGQLGTLGYNQAKDNQEAWGDLAYSVGKLMTRL